MNILKGNFNINVVRPISRGSRMDFHTSSQAFMPAINPSRKFDDTDVIDQNTHEENIASCFREINYFEVRDQEETVKQKSGNSSSMVPVKLEKQSFDRELVIPASRKRSHESNKLMKSSRRQNKNRQITSEMMDIDFNKDSTQPSPPIIDEVDEIDASHAVTAQVLTPINSSPISVPILNISLNTHRPCLAFSISPPRRPRHISTSESEDSFVVFDSGTDDECDFSGDIEFEIDNNVEEDSMEHSCDDESGTDTSSSVIPTKKVRFAGDKDLCEVHPMIQWSFAYKAARRGPWEMYARDSERFKNKIKLIEEKIGHCFVPEHRQKIYDQRFQS